MKRRPQLEEINLQDAERQRPPEAPEKPREEHLLTGDPGTVQAAAAYFRDGELVRGVLLAPDARLSIGLRVALVGQQLEAWLPTLKLPVQARAVLEFPEIYKRGPAANVVRTRDILWIAAAAGAMAAALLPYAFAIDSEAPKDHKGQKEKLAHNDICRDILTPKEKKALGPLVKNNNVMDAVSVGLHHLWRLQ